MCLIYPFSLYLLALFGVLHIKAVVCQVLHSLHICPLNFLGAPMCKHSVRVCVEGRCLRVCVCLLIGGVIGFVFCALWGQIGITELTMHLFVCNQPETSSKQTQSCWSETPNVHIFHLGPNLLFTQIPTVQEMYWISSSFRVFWWLMNSLKRLNRTEVIDWSV